MRRVRATRRDDEEVRNEEDGSGVPGEEGEGREEGEQEGVVYSASSGRSLGEEEDDEVPQGIQLVLAHTHTYDGQDYGPGTVTVTSRRLAKALQESHKRAVTVRHNQLYPS